MLESFPSLAYSGYREVGSRASGHATIEEEVREERGLVPLRKLFPILGHLSFDLRSSGRNVFANFLSGQTGVCERLSVES